MSRTLIRAAVGIAALAAGTACAPPASQGGGASRAPEPGEHALSGLAAQHVAILPTYMVRIGPGLEWSSSIGRLEDVKRSLDADIEAAFADRGVKSNWVFPPALEQSYRRNSSYASDPYTLAEEPLRSPSLSSEERLPDPLATQIRTLVALHDDVRYVLAPVELRLERTSSGDPATMGHGVLRLVLIDARLSSIRWSGDITSDKASAYGPVITASIGARLASVVSPQ